MTYSLFIDDERMPPANGANWIIARDFEQVQLIIWREGMPAFVSFDHDLGNEVLSGYDIAKFLVELDMDIDNDLHLPLTFEFYVHSQNPVGAENIRHYMNNYLKFKSQQQQNL